MITLNYCEGCSKIRNIRGSKLYPSWFAKDCRVCLMEGILVSCDGDKTHTHTHTSHSPPHPPQTHTHQPAPFSPAIQTHSHAFTYLLSQPHEELKIADSTTRGVGGRRGIGERKDEQSQLKKHRAHQKQGKARRKSATYRHLAAKVKTKVEQNCSSYSFIASSRLHNLLKTQQAASNLIS